MIAYGHTAAVLAKPAIQLCCYHVNLSYYLWPQQLCWPTTIMCCWWRLNLSFLLFCHQISDIDRLIIKLAKCSRVTQAFKTQSKIWGNLPPPKKRRPKCQNFSTFTIWSRISPEHNRKRSCKLSWSRLLHLVNFGLQTAKKQERSFLFHAI